MRRFVLWLVIILLSVSLLGVLWKGHEVLNRQAQTIDSLQTVHQQTVKQLRDAKRLANSNTNGLSKAEEREILWATRTIISETKNVSEMLLIANVIRNRVDLDYRGKETAKQIVLDPYQFSAFNPGRSRRWRYINMTDQHVDDALWQDAWNAARFAMTAPREVLPFSNACINHFVHPGGLTSTPNWMYNMEQVDLGDVQRPEIVFFEQNRDEICQIDQSTSGGPTPPR